MSSVNASSPPQAQPRSPAYLRFRVMMYASLAVIVTLAICIVIWQINSAQKERQNDVKSQTRSVIPLVETHVQQSIKFADAALVTFSNAIKLLPSQQQSTATAIASLLSSRGPNLDNDFYTFFVDANGNGVATSDDSNFDGKSFQDHDYFKIHAGDAKAGKLFISEPSISTISKRQTFFISRRVEDSAGKFIGVVVAAMEAQRFSKVFESMRPDSNLAIALIHRQGKLIAYTSHYARLFATDLSSITLFGQLSKQAEGSFQSANTIDKNPRIVSYRALNNLPLVVTVSISEGAAYASIKNNSWIAAGGISFMVAIMFVGGQIGLNIFAKLEDKNNRFRQLYDTSKETEQKLKASRRRLRLIADNLPVLIGYLDKQERFTFANRKHELTFGVPHQQLPGKSLAEVIGPEAYAQSIPYIQQALAGTEVHFERKVIRNDVERWESVTYIPNKHEDSLVAGFFFMIDDITERKKTEALVWKHANFDTLTGLTNRNMFTELLRVEMKKSDRSNHPMALVYIDLDHFKEINDSQGHDSGDQVLQETARRLSDCVRSSDTVSRLGGDEFTVILGELTDAGDVVRIAQDILVRLAAPFQLKDQVAYVSASIGITLYPNDGDTIDILLRNADQAMYSAKKQGRNRFNYFAPFMQEATLNRNVMTNELREALEQNELQVQYQPIVNLRTGKPEGAEALLRWFHPVRGLVMPQEFMTIAENTGMIVTLGDWVFEQAVQLSRRMHRMGIPEFQVSVNASSLQLRYDGTAHKPWIARLEEVKQAARTIMIEVTEDVLENADETLTKRLLGLREAGVQMSLDDFGTGYSSLSLLRKFGIGYIKMDRSMLAGLTLGSDQLLVCEAVIAMAHKLNMKVIAIGVETEEQMELLKSVGCDLGQGYYFSPPVYAYELDRYVENH